MKHTELFKVKAQDGYMLKDNLNICIFPKHDHDLNYLQYPFYGIISEGLMCVFNTAQILL